MKQLNYPCPNPGRRDFLKWTAAGTTAALAWRGHGDMRAATNRAGGDLDPSRWLQPVPPHAIFTEPGYYVWCGTMVRGADGRCHLYYSRWRGKEGFAAWVTHSEVARAVSEHPLGPYRPAGVVLPARGPEFWDGHCTHNPTIMTHAGKFYLYYMGNRGDRKKTQGLNWSHRNNQRIGVAVADAPEGPWRRFDRPLIDTTPGFHDALMCSNPAVMLRADGSFEMIYKGVADKKPMPFGGPVVHIAATAGSPTGPFKKHPDALFTHEGATFPAEDPFVWRDGDQYWAIVKDMKGYFTQAGRSLALMHSRDGYAWRPAAHPLVSRTEIRRTDGTVQKLHALERPQVWFDRGEPAILFCAASVAAETKAETTFNVAIPLVRPS